MSSTLMSTQSEPDLDIPKARYFPSFEIDQELKEAVPSFENLFGSKSVFSDSPSISLRMD